MGNGEYEFYIARATLQSDVLGGSRNTANIVKAAISTGLILPDSDGNTARLVRLPEIGQKRVLCIVPASYKAEASSKKEVPPCAT